MPAMMKIVVPPGLGDFSWVYSKINTLRIPLHVSICEAGPSRLAPLTQILPMVRSHDSIRMNYHTTYLPKTVPMTTTKQQLLDMAERGQQIYIQANKHLEDGMRIERWLPDISVDYHYPIKIPKEDIAAALSMLPYTRFIALYASSISTASAWKTWMPPQWVEFMERCRAEISDCPFVLIGAPYDLEMAVQIEALAKAKQLPFLNLVGKTTIGACLHIMSLAKYFVSFPSGLGILSDVICVPATMFYPQALPKMPGSYGDPLRIQSLTFHETFFVPPAEQVKWMKDTFHLKDKL